MQYFLTSSPFAPGAPRLNPQNGFVDALKRALPAPVPALFVCADPDRHAYTDKISQEMRWALEDAGISLSAFQVLDGRNQGDAEKLVKKAGLLVLAGGHVPTQNAFFQAAGLKQCLRFFDGVVLGISAGTMNCAATVYAQPEEEGEATDPAYRRFLPGLGITRTMLLPHYQMVKDSLVDSLRLFADITLPDSMGRTFYAVPDGSYLLGLNGRETLWGEAHRIRDGRMEQISRENEVFPQSIDEADALPSKVCKQSFDGNINLL